MAALHPKLINDISQDGDVKLAHCGNIMKAIPKDSAKILSTLISASPLLRYSVGMNGQIWQQQQNDAEKQAAEKEKAAASSQQKDAVEQNIISTREIKAKRWTSETSFFHVSGAKHQNKHVIFHPTLRTRLIRASSTTGGEMGTPQSSTDVVGGGGESSSSTQQDIVAGVPEYDIRVHLLPFKKDQFWMQDLLRKASFLGPCIRSFKAEYNRHVTDELLNQIAWKHPLEELGITACPITPSTLLSPDGSNSVVNFTKLRSLSIGVMNLGTNSVDTVGERFPVLEEVKFFDVKDAAAFLLALPTDSLRSLQLHDTDISPDDLVKVMKRQTKVRNFGISSATLKLEGITSTHLEEIFAAAPNIVELHIEASLMPMLVAVASGGAAVGTIRYLKCLNTMPDTVNTIDFAKNYAPRLQSVIVVLANSVSPGAKKDFYLREEMHKIKGAVEVDYQVKKEFLKL